MPVAFDTHQLITRLTEGQMTLAQAEAVSAALQQALESSIGQLATKQDLHALETAIAAKVDRVQGHLTLLQWVVGIGLPGVLALTVLNLNWSWQILQRLPLKP